MALVSVWASAHGGEAAQDKKGQEEASRRRGHTVILVVLPIPCLQHEEGTRDVGRGRAKMCGDNRGSGLAPMDIERGRDLLEEEELSSHVSDTERSYM